MKVFNPPPITAKCLNFFYTNSPFPFLHQSRKYSNLTILSCLFWKGSPSYRIYLFFYFCFPGCVEICIKAPSVKILLPPDNFIIYHTIFLLLPIVGDTKSTLWVLSNLSLTWLPTPIISSAQMLFEAIQTHITLSGISAGLKTTALPSGAATLKPLLNGVQDILLFLNPHNPATLIPQTPLFLLIPLQSNFLFSHWPGTSSKLREAWSLTFLRFKEC